MGGYSIVFGEDREEVNKVIITAGGMRAVLLLPMVWKQSYL